MAKISANTIRRLSDVNDWRVTRMRQLFEEVSEEEQQAMLAWMNSVASFFEKRRLGTAGMLELLYVRMELEAGCIEKIPANISRIIKERFKEGKV